MPEPQRSDNFRSSLLHSKTLTNRVSKTFSDGPELSPVKSDPRPSIIAKQSFRMNGMGPKNSPVLSEIDECDVSKESHNDEN